MLRHTLWIIFIILLTACTPAPLAITDLPGPSQPALTAPARSQPSIPVVSPTVPAYEPEITSLPTEIVVPSDAAPTAEEVSTTQSSTCTPLQDIPIETLAGMISNPYHPPKPGYDDPHAGIDIAVMLPDSRISVAGHPVQAAMAGRVAMISVDRFPFGNAILIETPLEALPGDWQTRAAVPTPAPTLPPLSALTCPAALILEGVDPQRRSLYTLYAHLQEPPAWQLGDEITCGQVIANVGGTGNALNPHLHYETRVGPAGIRLPAMAHYDASATPEEMSSYCQWSVSGLFQLVDPQKALGITP